MGLVAASKLVTTALSYVGRLTYCVGGDHATVLDPNPYCVDCSSFIRLTAYHGFGRDLFGPGTSEIYFGNARNGHYGGLRAGPCKKGDVIFRVGDGSFFPPGHIAIATQDETVEGLIVCVSALGTGLGVRVDSITRFGGQYMGACVPANLFPDPTPTETEMDLFIAQSWNGPATLLYQVGPHTARGIAADEAAFLKGKVPVETPALSVRQEYTRDGSVDDSEFLAFSEFDPTAHALTEQPV